MVKRLRKLTKRPSLLIAVLVLLVASAVFGWIHWHSNKPTSTATGGALSPPTASEKAAGDNQKTQIVQDQNNQSAASGQTTKNVSIVITEASGTTVKGYIQGVFEDGGTCTATGTKGSQTVTKTSTAFGNVSYTQCTPISWSLGSGAWTINLSYKSNDASGSASKTIKVN